MNDPVDIKDITIADIFNSIKRLKLSSVIWLGTILVVLISGAYSFGVASNWLSAMPPEIDSTENQPAFTPLFTESFVDRNTLQLLIPDILDLSPDGIETEAEAMASLLWQIKAQDGYAQFLTGTTFVSVQITYADDAFNFNWTSGSNVIPKILKQLSFTISDDIVAQLNAEMNLMGVAWLPENNQIVRDIDGGLAVIGEE